MAILYEITQEGLEEFISLMKIELDYEVVEYLASLRDDIKDENTKAVLKKYILKYAEEFKMCSKCFEKLEPRFVREAHNELPGSPCEELFDGYVCTNCWEEY